MPLAVHCFVVLLFHLCWIHLLIAQILASKKVANWQTTDQCHCYVCTEVLSKLEKRDIPWERYYDMSSQVRLYYIYFVWSMPVSLNTLMESTHKHGHF